MDTESENGNCVLEVIACSVEDAVEAENGGADRLEVVRDIASGGYTPPLELLRQIRSRVGLPLRVMLREQSGCGLTQVIAVEKLCCVANELNKMKVDGVVIGFLHGKEVDLVMTRKILSCAPELNVTFHHAFEDVHDKFAAINEIKRIGRVDRILSHGGYGTQRQRIDNLSSYDKAGRPEIRILAGGRIDIEMISLLRRNTRIREFHIGGAARENGRVTARRVEMLSKAVLGAYV
ncbi:MAG TPA: copper homeostasis protein CutC [Pyrinomonadaceae bacterium]|nr:copper homeostasis protein CutC [Pyrinomonadaceae bacterium]